MGFLVFLVFAAILMWLLFVLPQRRQRAAHKALIESIEPGVEVLTAGGLYGDVVEVGDDELAVEIAPGVVVRVAVRAVASVIPPDAYEDEEEAAEEHAELAPAEEVAEALPEGDRASMERDRR